MTTFEADKQLIQQPDYGLQQGILFSIEFKFHYLKNLKLFEAIALRKTKTVFALLKSIENGNMHFTKNWLDRNEVWSAEDNHSYLCHICANGILDLNFS